MRNFVIKVLSDEDRGQDDEGAPTVKSNIIPLTYCTDRIHLQGHMSLLMCQLFDGEPRVLCVRVPMCVFAPCSDAPQEGEGHCQSSADMLYLIVQHSD